MNDTSEATYGEVLRGNRNFRALWLGTTVSMFGDWFNTITLFTMVRELTGSPLAVGLVDALKMGGYAAASIPGGILADRFDRRTLMIAADFLRALIVCGYFLVDSKADVPFLYVLVVTQVGLGAVFDPSYRALLPNLVAPRELMAANTLLSMTWSTVLAVAAAVGGLVANALGHDAVFAISVATYLFSAVCILSIRVPRADATVDVAPGLPRAKRIRPTQLAMVAYGDLRDGLRYLFKNGRVLKLACAKTAWVLGGGALVYFLTQLGPLLSPGDSALGIGILYSARGFGTGVGPFFSRRLFLDRRKWGVVCGLAVAVSGLSYLMLGVLPWSFACVVLIVLAHAASGSNWVLSTVLLQGLVPDRVRGRVFAAELFLLTVFEALVVLAAAAMLEAGVFDLATGICAFAGLQLVSGIAYALWIRRDADA